MRLTLPLRAFSMGGTVEPSRARLDGGEARRRSGSRRGASTGVGALSSRMCRGTCAGAPGSGGATPWRCCVGIVDENRTLIEGFWADLYRQDLEAAARPLHARGRVHRRGDTRGRRGPRARRNRPAPDARLRQAHRAAGRTTTPGRRRRRGRRPEHIEHWAWPTGETMALPVASVHEVRDGRITRWTDYWDMERARGRRPQWWFDHVITGWK